MSLAGLLGECKAAAASLFQVLLPLYEELTWNGEPEPVPMLACVRVQVLIQCISGELVLYYQSSSHLKRAAPLLTGSDRQQGAVTQSMRATLVLRGSEALCSVCLL